MKKFFKRSVSVLLSAVMIGSCAAYSVFSTGAQESTASTSVASASDLPENIKDGAILHCWCWDFNTIKENIPQIAAAGFKSIQTSPINAVKRGDNGQMSLKSNNKGNWWYQYQPTDYTIGNYQLGTEEEFSEMCEEAHKYGIKVIVDIVANHCSSDYSVISSHVKNIGGKAFHDRVEISDWSNRYQVTQGKLTGLWDLNTQNPAVQQMILDYCNEVLEAGADGFRFDAAKHIELPDDDSSYAGDFWPTVLDNNAEFQYGEILTGSDRAADYAKIMRITADAYGTNLRTGLSRHTVNVNTIKNYRITDVDADRIVTWVESHDNFCSDDNSSWTILNNQQIRQGWAFICAQGDTTPLFFARPQGSSAYDPSASDSENFNNKWGDNTIGLAGDGNYFSAEVEAVNKFRNAMVGEGKNLVNVVKNKVTMIERGTKGAVLVSVSENDTNINVSTNLAEGTYVDQANGGTFVVSGGKLTGSLKAGSVAVLYTPDEGSDFILGDINGDGRLTIEDATLLQRYLADFRNADGTPIIDPEDPAQFKIADFNGDKKININDVTDMQRNLAELNVSLR